MACLLLVMEGLSGKEKVPHTGKVFVTHRLELVRFDKGRSASTIKNTVSAEEGRGQDNPKDHSQNAHTHGHTNPIFSFVLIFNPHNSRHGNNAKSTSHTPDSTAFNSP